MRKMSIVLSTAVAVIGLAVVGAAPAGAQSTPIGPEFGQHVAGCVQTMGFDGVHNPGMHQGFSGWDGMPC